MCDFIKNRLEKRKVASLRFPWVQAGERIVASLRVPVVQANERIVASLRVPVAQAGGRIVASLRVPVAKDGVKKWSIEKKSRFAPICFELTISLRDLGPGPQI